MSTLSRWFLPRAYRKTAQPAPTVPGRVGGAARRVRLRLSLAFQLQYLPTAGKRPLASGAISFMGVNLRTGAKGFFTCPPRAELHLNTRVGQGDIPQSLEFTGENIRNGGRGIDQVIIGALSSAISISNFSLNSIPTPSVLHEMRARCWRASSRHLRSSYVWPSVRSSSRFRRFGE